MNPGEKSRKIVLGELASVAVRGVPAYGRGLVTREYELAVIRYRSPGYSPADTDLYLHQLYDQEKFYRPRRRLPATTRDEKRHFGT